MTVRGTSKASTGALLCLSLALIGAAGCSATSGASKDPEGAAVERLTAQGFVVVTEGRGQPATTVLRYQGDPAAVLTCQVPGGKAAATDQTGSATTTDGQHVVTQKGNVWANVIVVDTGGTRGLYVNSLYRTVATPDGRVVANQLETIEFGPGSSGTFRNGMTCQAKT